MFGFLLGARARRRSSYETSVIDEIGKETTTVLEDVLGYEGVVGGSPSAEGDQAKASSG
jgi:hypothetical protein